MNAKNEAVREREIDRIWDSWENHVEEDIKRLAHRVTVAKKEMGLFGINQKIRDKFVYEKMNEMFIHYFKPSEGG